MGQVWHCQWWHRDLLLATQMQHCAAHANHDRLRLVYRLEEETMSRTALALGQVQAKGKLAGGEMLQLTEAGLNVRQILADSFHKSTEEIVKMQERGLIPADKAIKAIVESLERDFGGAAKRQAGTWAGLLNSLDDIKNIGLREFFTGTFQAIQPLVNQFVDTLPKPEVLTNIRGWGEGLGQFAKTGATAYRRLLLGRVCQLPPDREDRGRGMGHDRRGRGRAKGRAHCQHG